MVKIEIKNVIFEKKGEKILDNINLTIEDKEYCIFVGPTGAGKTSLIGLITGIYKPNSGQIFFDGVDVTQLSPEDRSCGVMFESYALFPHINILDNVSYSRHLRVENRDETHNIGRELLSLVRINNRDTALPKECSGGMQQRVALARSLMAIEASGLLILDEPFKALDAGLRLNLRKEVRDIIKSETLGLTTIHITNDMQEAMMGDKIVVIDKGKIRQVGTPKEIMYYPNDLFVTNFFSTELNYFNGKVLKIEEAVPKKKLNQVYDPELKKVIIQTEEGYFLYAKTIKKFIVGDDVTFIVRSQYFKARHKRREDKTNSIVGFVKRVKFMGAWLRIEVEAPYKPEYLLEDCLDDIVECRNMQLKLLKVEVPTTRVALHNFVPGETITLFYPSEFVIVFPKIDKEVLEAELRVN